MPELSNSAPADGALTLRDGWQWLGTGFARYRRNPVLLMFWVMSYWTSLGLLGLVPVAGDILVAALAPVLMIGVLAGCRALDQETMPPFTVLFSGFGTRLQPLMGLGVLHFLLTLGVLTLTALADGGVLLQYMARGTLGAPEMAMPDAAQWSLLGLLLALLVYVPVMLAFAYAPLLVAWRGFGLTKALFFSLVGSLRAWRALFGFLMAIAAYGVLLPSLIMMTLFALGLSENLVMALVIVPIMAILAPTVVSGFYTSYGAVLPESASVTRANAVGQ